MIIIAGIVAVAVLVISLVPLWRVPVSETLAEGHVATDPHQLLLWRDKVREDLKMLHQDYAAKNISEKLWRAKKEVLVNRYVSLEQRRLYLQSRSRAGAAS